MRKHLCTLPRKPSDRFDLAHLCGLPDCRNENPRCSILIITSWFFFIRITFSSHELTNGLTAVTFDQQLLFSSCYFLQFAAITCCCYFWSPPLLEPFPFQTGAPLTVRPALQVKRLFNVEEQLLCRVSEIEIEKEKAAASANLEAENFAAKRRSHHPGMRECFFDQWIFHSVWQHFHFQIQPA